MKNLEFIADTGEQLAFLLYSMRAEKRQIENPNSNSPPNQPKKPPKISNFYVEELKKFFSPSEQSCPNFDSLVNLVHKVGIHFLVELADKLSADDYKTFVSSLVLMEKDEGAFIIEKGKRVSNLYILVEGIVKYGLKTENEEESTWIGTGYPGYLIYPEIFVAPRCFNCTVACEKSCTFLAINEELYNKYVKKIIMREAENLAQMLCQTLIFSGLNTLALRKYCPFFIPRSYRYNETIYSRGDACTQLFVILEGEVELYSKRAETIVNLVKLGARECFGIETGGQRTLFAKSVTEHLKVLALNAHVLNIIRAEYPIVSQKCQKHSRRVEKVHTQLLRKNIKVLDQRLTVGEDVKKKKKKRGKKSENSLAWWGLAEDIKAEHKYKMPSPPKLITPKVCHPIAHNKGSPRTYMTFKMQGLRRRLADTEMAESQLEDFNEDQQNMPVNSWRSKPMYSRSKTKMRAVEARPKAVDMAEMIKKKLVGYARNMGSFCDRLNLQ